MQIIKIVLTGLICLSATFLLRVSGYSASVDLKSGNYKDYILIGTDKGLFFWDTKQTFEKLWSDSIEVRKVLVLPDGYFFLTSAGVVYSADLHSFEYRNTGLITKTIKHYQNGTKSFSNEIQDLKDLEADPYSPMNMATCSRDGIFYTTNGGLSWKNLTNPYPEAGNKSVAIYSNPDLIVLTGHPFKGIYMKDVTRGTAWQSINTGLAKYAGFFHEEISDILVSTNNGTLSIYAANNFRPSIYKMDMKDKSWAPVLELPGDFGFIESLSVDSSDKLTFVNTTGALGYNIDTKVYSTIDLSLLKKTAEDKAGAKLECVYVVTNSKPAYQFNNLWLLNNAPDRKYTTIAGNKKGIYVQPNLVKRPAKFNAMLSVMSNNNLNLMVIDMKDDWGNLRFKPDSDILKKMGRTAGSIDLPPFIKSMKDRSIYLVARLVLFQDHVIYDYNNHEFAVKSASTKQAWQGTKKQKDGTIKQIQEFWVDPYSEKVWEYNVAIAKELIQKGFDEIQFDYVRFPTDGLNLEDASFSWRDPGMDKESAIMSFLAYARENIDAPISIDIYGANGWYRTGARTGQDVELFRKYVDVICPMFYPSHFEQNFMAYDPAEKRPFRIYYFGDLRNYYIARKSLVIRPYVQAFNLHVSYDRKYFGPDYVAEEIKGVDESTSMGYTFWNMGGQYSILNDAYQKIAEKKSPQVKK